MSSTKIDYIMMVDTSGSMHNLYTNGYVKEAGQAFLENVKEKNPDKLVMFASFSHIIKINEPVPVKDAVFPDYQADLQGMTALYKAVCESVKSGLLSEKGVLFIITDGCNTAYDEYKRDFQETLAKIQKDGWEVCFIGSDQNVVNSGIAAGIPARCCAAFDSSKPESLVYLSRAVSQAVGSQEPGTPLDIRALSTPGVIHDTSLPFTQAPFQAPFQAPLLQRGITVSRLKRSVCGSD